MIPGQDTPAPFGLGRLRGSPLARRVATGLVAVPILVGVVLVGGHLWTAIVALVLALAMWEFATTMGLGQRDPCAGSPSLLARPWRRSPAPPTSPPPGP